jgi:putative ABC transport system permease protein
MNYHPPRLARRLFEIVCGSAKVDDLIGDLDEWFYVNLKSKGLVRAKLLYWKQVLSLSTSYAIRKRKRDAHLSHYSSSNFSISMLQNYIKVAIRNLYQHKYFSALNAFGLAMGMSISLLLIALVSYIKTYDTFHLNKDNIYTIVTSRSEGIEQADYATAPILLAEKLKQYPGVDEVVRIQSGFREEIKHGASSLPLQGYYVEPNFLTVFTYEVMQGHAASTLNTPNRLIITESAARKLFNTTDVLGKTLELKQGGLLEIGAVMKDHPINSHLKFEVLIAYNTLPVSQRSLTEQWTSYGREYLYVLLSPNDTQSALQKFLNEVAASTYKTFPVKVAFSTQHLSEITMGPDYRMAIGPKWEASGMIVFAIIAALILLPACFNYTNISIARALKRSKEIGLRKTMGGVKNQIFFQFITETVVITMISLIGGIIIFFLIRSEFQTMLVASSSLDLSLTPRVIALFVLFALITGFLAGFFPAVYFGGLNPIQALKSKSTARGSSGMRVRKTLTVFQFALTFGFILSLVVFSRQYKYSLNFDFGFAKENIVDVTLQGVDPDLVGAEFSSQSTVQAVSMSSDIMGLSFSTAWVYTTRNDSTEVSQLFVDNQYIPVLGLTLIAGSNFPEETWQRERFIIVNEEFLKAYRIERAADALGRTFNVEGNELEIIGVVKNFHFAPLRFPISKFFFRMNPSQFAYANLQVRTQDAKSLFDQLEDSWGKLSPEQKLEARFFEDELNEGYSMYQVLLKIIGFLGLLAITISLLGMLGMVVYTSETKAKEVGIRKVMGATVYSIAFLLSKDYLKLMLIAIVLAVPLTAYFFQLVLPEIQYYSVSMTVWDVLLSALFLLTIGIATITSQTYKTALANPAQTLRVE